MSKYNLTLRDQLTEFLLYTAPNGAIKVEVLLSNENIWLPQKRLRRQCRASRRNRKPLPSMKSSIHSSASNMISTAR